MFRVVCNRVATTVVAAVVLGVPALAGTNLVVDGDFTNPNVGSSYVTYAAGSTFGAWTVTKGTVDLVGGLWDYPVAGQQSVDLDGSSTAVGGIKQSITTNFGSDYILSFDLSSVHGGTTLKTVQVLWDGIDVGQFTFNRYGIHGTDMGWITENLTLSGLGTAADLAFVSLSADGQKWGPVIANVSLTEVAPDPVPEPAFYQMGAMLALGGLGLLRLRKRA
jgi:choice-of-anchor C domain-containing protein